MGVRSVQRVIWVRSAATSGTWPSSASRAAACVATRRLAAEGYGLLLGARQPDELPFDYTSILADNARARRLLEAGLPRGCPGTPLARYVKLSLPVGTAAARARRRLTIWRWRLRPDWRPSQACLGRHQARAAAGGLLDG